MNVPQKQIPPQRQSLYYAGMAVSVIGLLLFLSTFVTFIANFGNFDNFVGQAQSSAMRAFGGMAMLMAGGVMMGIGARGLAGSGLVLDPEKARKDVEPWNRMAGGMTQDALSEIELVKKLEGRLGAQPTEVKVRCKACQALNDESAKYCSQCGAAI